MTADLLVGATEEQIRQLFRRINSYTVPLNPQEQRHATHQGAFKWFMVELTEEYAQSLKNMGVLKEKQLSRMQDAQLFTEITLALLQGIEAYSRPKLDNCYSDLDDSFTQAKDISKRFDTVFDYLLEWQALHNSSLMKPGPLYSLCLAIAHIVSPVESLKPLYETSTKGIKDWAVALRRLSLLAKAADEESPPAKYVRFKHACEEATNTKDNRAIRFTFFCEAMNTRAA